jgi:hypothetical protein
MLHIQNLIFTFKSSVKNDISIKHCWMFSDLK